MLNAIKASKINNISDTAVNLIVPAIAHTFSGAVTSLPVALVKYIKVRFG